MYIIIIFFTSLFLLKSILFNHFYSNYLYLFIYPLELSILSLFNPKNNLNSYIRWIFLGCIDLEHDDYMEIDTLKKLQNNDSPYTMIICWIFTIFLYQIYYLINEYYIKHNQINKWSFYSYNLKFCMINYLPLYLWNLNTLINSTDSNFVMVFINLFLFNAITFWFTGYLFNFIYGEKLYIYRIKFSFLIENINPMYKYFSIIMIGLKALVGTYIVFFDLIYDFRLIPLVICLFIYLIIFTRKNIFNSNCEHNNIYNIKKFTIILTFVSFLIILISMIESFFMNNLVFLVIEIILILIYFCLMIFFIRNIERNMIEYDTSENIEMVLISS